MTESEKPPSYYDETFQNEAGFQVHYKKAFYYVHWTQVIVFLRKIADPRIFEIGCGTGQLAEYLSDEGFLSYEGFDFSPTAIKFASRRVDMSFFQGDALDRSIYQRPFNTVICLEVLEHISRDLDVLNNIPQGVNIIFSIPNFDAPSHVRWFTSERQIKKRYFRHIDIKEIVRVGNIYLCRGIVDRFKPSFVQSFLASRETVDLSSFTRRISHRLKNRLKLKWLP